MRYIIGVGLVITIVAVNLRAADDWEAPKLQPSEATAPTVASAWEEVTEQDPVPGVHENRGNWFFKAQILKKAIEPVKQVQNIVKDIVPFKEIFEKRRAEFDATFDAFLQDYGFGDSVVATHLEFVAGEINRFEQLRQQPPARSPSVIPGQKGASSRAVALPNYAEEVQKLKVTQTDIEKLRNQMSRLEAYKSALSEGISLLNRSIEQAVESEKNAWSDYEKIADTLSDIVAENMYRSIEVALTNVQNVKQYCTETFEAFFNELTRDTIALEDEIKSGIESLLKRGYAFGKKAGEQLQAERDAAAAESARVKALQKPKKEEPASWWHVMTDYVATAWQKVVDVVSAASGAVASFFRRK